MGGCKWNPLWAAEFPWAKPCPSDPTKIGCTVCQVQFSCDKGRGDVKRHGLGVKHVTKEKNLAADKLKGVLTKNDSIQDSFKKHEKAAKEQRKSKDQALRAEAALCSLIATHNLPLAMMDCLAVLLPKIITDSEIVKQMNLHRTKAVYTLEFGVAKHERDKILKQLALWPFSLNFDESVKGKASQLELVVIFRNTKDLIQRSHLVTVNMKERLTGENISNAVFEAMDKMNINYEVGLVSERTDGCSTMLGVRIGCHAFSKKKVRYFIQKFTSSYVMTHVTLSANDRSQPKDQI
jgi:hypothetical protein